MSSINASTTSIPAFDAGAIGGTTPATVSAYGSPYASAPAAPVAAPAAHVHDAAAPAATAQAGTGAASLGSQPNLVAALQQLLVVLQQLTAVLGAQSGAAALSGGGGAPGKSPIQAPIGGGGVAAGGPSTLHGTLQPGNKQVSGGAAITTGANGQRTLDLTNLKTEHGPDLHVYLAANNPTTDAGVTDFVDLGKLGNENGNSSYAIPAGTDLSKYGTLVIWCDEANTTFGRAPLTAG